MWYSTKPFCAVWLSPQLPVDCQKSPGVPLPHHLSSQRSPYTVFPILGGASFGESPYSTYLVKVSITCLCKWCVCALADLMAPHMPCVMDCGDIWDWVCNYEAMFVLV